MEGNTPTEDSRQALHDIRSIMERSSRFLSLSGWSGIWAGCTALAGAAIGQIWLPPGVLYGEAAGPGRYGGAEPFCFCGAAFYKPLLLAVAIFIVALAGGYYFTWQKMRRQRATIWNHASRQMMWALAAPLAAGGIFVLAFMRHGHAIYIAPACLAFYGLALVNGSKYTLTDIRYLGYLEVLLGVLCLFVPGWGFYFWVLGFGVLHILYGIIMWNKYDKGMKE
jgi:hypothetical protein